jgi:RHS repeat-associated protein
VINTHKEQNSTETKEIIYEYDEIGNIIKDEKHSYGYDGRGRLTSIDSNVTYQYNYDNRRVSKTVNGITTYFIYNGHMLIGEYNEKVEPIKEYLYLNSTPIAILADNKTYKIYSDHLDTPRRVADNSTNIIWSWNSKPFGDTMAEEDVDDNNQKFVMNLRFPGQYFDSESGTHYNINRDYNPLTGRYIQSDPIGFDGGVNSFGYVGGMPIVAIDKEGLWCWFGWFRKCDDEYNKVLTFEGIFETVAAIGAGETAMIGTYTDGQRGKNGRFKSVGVAWGFDASFGGIKGEVYVKDAYSKFMGKGTSISLGIGMVGGGAMFANGTKIGKFFTVDGSPLPASFTFSATTTTEL